MCPLNSVWRGHYPQYNEPCVNNLIWWGSCLKFQRSAPIFFDYSLIYERAPLHKWDNSVFVLSFWLYSYFKWTWLHAAKPPKNKLVLQTMFCCWSNHKHETYDVVGICGYSASFQTMAHSRCERVMNSFVHCYHHYNHFRWWNVWPGGRHILDSGTFLARTHKQM